MIYDFDKVVPRCGTNSVKWDERLELEPVSDASFCEEAEKDFALGTMSDDIIPLWVADMDFPTYPAITEELRQRVGHGIFGYTFVSQSYYDAVISWFRQQHGWKGIERSDIIYTPGVVPAISAIIRALTLPGDKVLVQTPVYNCFFSCIRNQGCLVEELPLVYSTLDGLKNIGLHCRNTSHSDVPFTGEASSISTDKYFPAKGLFSYSVDWDAFEMACADPRVRIFLLCNPHNPAGRVWTREELQRMGDICLKHDVFVIADEIHCEFTMPGHQFTPFASVCEDFMQNSAVCVAPTKAFNIAGLQIANIITRNANKRERIDRVINLHEVCDVNPFGVLATEVAYTEGGAIWLSELNTYIADNYRFLVSFFVERLPQFPVALLEGTYLVWVDCSVLGKSSSCIVNTLYRHCAVWLNGGEMYGERHRSFVRINIACPRSVLEEGLRRIYKGLLLLNHK